MAYNQNTKIRNIEILCARKSTFIINVLQQINENNGYKQINTPNFSLISKIILEDPEFEYYVDNTEYGSKVWAYIQAILKNPLINKFQNSIEYTEYLEVIYKLCNTFPQDHPFWKWEPKTFINEKDASNWFLECDYTGQERINNLLNIDNKFKKYPLVYMRIVNSIQNSCNLISQKNPIYLEPTNLELETTFNAIGKQFKKSSFLKQLFRCGQLRKESKLEGVHQFLTTLEEKNDKLTKTINSITNDYEITNKVISMITNSLVFGETTSKEFSKLSSIPVNNNIYVPSTNF